MRTGYDVFGKAYGVMLRNDLHAPQSIDHALLQRMIRVEEGSHALLYHTAPQRYDMTAHELYSFAQRFQADSERKTIENILHYTAKLAHDFDVPFESMLFGGTEAEILARGTDWCADMARLGAVLLDCCGIPARIVDLVNTEKAYHGHVVTEAYYEGKWGVCDFLNGYRLSLQKPLDAYELVTNPQALPGFPENDLAQFGAAAISEYDPNARENDYTISTPNAYYLTLIGTQHQGKWIMGEEN